MIKFKGKEYPVKDLFVRDQAKMIKLSRKLNESDDEEEKADSLIKMINLGTGIDIGDLNGSKYVEIAKLCSEMTDIIKQRGEEERKKEKALETSQPE